MKDQEKKSEPWWIRELKKYDRLLEMGDEYISVVESALESDGQIIAAALSEFNDWRRGEGEYEFDENPRKNKEFWMTPKLLGIVIDVAANMCRKDDGL